MTTWKPYRPSGARPWTRGLAAHLYRRAGFGPSAGDLDRALADGPQETVTRLLAGEPETRQYAETSAFLAGRDALPAGAPPAKLAAWWVRRMLSTPHPLREKLAFFWHDHFATSVAKVRDARLMLAQYELLWDYALGEFSELLPRMATDPAMAVWLDTVGSRAGKPNENYARELMELFTLGVGHYTETDVRQAARAFTGFELKGHKLTRNSRYADGGEKTVLGRTGRFGPGDIAAICLDQPACSRFLAGKLYREFVSESPAPPALLDTLAAKLQASDYDTATAAELILRSEHFYSPDSVRRKVKSPVEFAVGLVRAVGGNPGPLPLAEGLAGLGQLPFSPPSVAGWEGGRAWLSGQTLLARQNLALALLSGDDSRFARRCDPTPLAGGKSGPEAVDAILAALLPGVEVPAGRAALVKLARTPAGTPQALAHAATCLPDYQLN